MARAETEEGDVGVAVVRAAVMVRAAVAKAKAAVVRGKAVAATAWASAGMG